MIDSTWLAIFGSLAVWSLGWGILFRMGVVKWWYIGVRIPGITPRTAQYAGIPGGIGLAIIASAAFFPDPEKKWNLFLAGAIVIFAGFVVATFRPGFLKPKWLRWLESGYTHLTINLLVEEARKLGWWEWQKRVWTQEGLEQWVEETLRKRGVNP